METGLNGWFGRFLKQVIVRVATLVDSAVSINTGTLVDTNFTDYANQIGSGGGSFWNREMSGEFPLFYSTVASIENDPRANYEPTASEEVILNKFTEEITGVIANLATITASLPLEKNIEQKVIIANELLQRFSVIKRFYQLNEKGGLSVQAIDLRNLVIEVLLLKLENDLSTEMAKFPSLTLQPVSSQNNAKELVAELYPLNKVTEMAFGSKFQIYKIQILELPPNGDLIDTNPIETIGTNPVQTTVRKFSFDWILWALAGFGIYKAVSKEEKKS